MVQVVAGVALAAAGLVAALLGQSGLSFALIVLGVIVALPAMRDLSNPLLGAAFVELLYIVVGLLVALQALYGLITDSEWIHILGLVAGVFMAGLGVDRLAAKRRFRSAS